MQFLLSMGASASLVTSSGDTALHLAAANGRHELCELLCAQRGVDLFAKNHEGATTTITTTTTTATSIIHH